MKPLRSSLALTCLFSVIIFQFTFAQSQLESGKQYYSTGNLDQAKSGISTYLRSNKRSPEAHFWMGRVLFDEDEYGDAAGHFEKAAKLDQGNSRYHLWLGHTYGRRAQESSKLRQPFLAKKSRSNYEKAVELAPENIEARESLIEFYLQAPGFMGGGRDKAEGQASAIMDLDKEAGYLAWGRIFTYYDEVKAATMNYTEAIEMHPELMRPYYRLYTYYFNEGEFESAIQLTEKQLNYNDTTGVIYLNYGNVLQRNEQYPEAVKAYTTALELEPELYNTWYQIGRLAAVSGEYLEDGFSYITRFIDLEDVNDQTKAWAYYRKGSILEHMQRKDDAMQQYELALQLDPAHEQAKAALNNLD